MSRWLTYQRERLLFRLALRPAPFLYLYRVSTVVAGIGVGALAILYGPLAAAGGFVLVVCGASAGLGLHFHERHGVTPDDRLEP